jgi:hypothetical protein
VHLYFAMFWTSKSWDTKVKGSFGLSAFWLWGFIFFGLVLIVGWLFFRLCAWVCVGFFAKDFLDGKRKQRTYSLIPVNISLPKFFWA